MNTCSKSPSMTLAHCVALIPTLNVHAWASISPVVNRKPTTTNDMLPEWSPIYRYLWRQNREDMLSILLDKNEWNPHFACPEYALKCTPQTHDSWQFPFLIHWTHKSPAWKTGVWRS
jgi:hypothetical protein